MSDAYTMFLLPAAFFMAAKLPLWGQPAQSVGGLAGSCTSTGGSGAGNSFTLTWSFSFDMVSGANSH